jgi:hypothetical protein
LPSYFAYARINGMNRGQLLNLKEQFEFSGKKINSTKALLLDIALGEKASLPPGRKRSQAFDDLRRYRFIRRTKNNYLVTNKGKSRLKTIFIEGVKIKHSKKWDGKWYLVLYDFPIRYKKARNGFRWKLKDLGFFQFQKSAWIYPYPCEEEIFLVADFWGVRKYIEIIEVIKISDDRKIRSHFGI